MMTTECFFFCLTTGAALGCLFLLCKLLLLFFRFGRVAQAVVDILFCLIAAAVVFLCALAVDSGRLRLMQAVLQLLGGWAVTAALDPFLCGAVRLLQNIFCKLSGFLKRKLSILTSCLHRKKKIAAKKREKGGGNTKKRRKGT